MVYGGDNPKLCQKRGQTLWRARGKLGKSGVPGQGQIPFLTEPKADVGRQASSTRPSRLTQVSAVCKRLAICLDTRQRPA